MNCELTPRYAARVDDPYATIARFYDRAVSGSDDDLPLYLALAQRYGPRVLELGCGTGRVAVPLAQAGYQVVGVDQSAAMLGLARERCAREGVSVEWIEGAIEAVELPRGAGLAICALDSFLHLTSRHAQEAALANVARALTDGGALALDLPTLAAWSDWSPGIRPLELVWSDHEPERGLVTHHFTSFRANPAEQTRHVTHIFEQQRADGTVRRWSAAYVLRFIGRFELALLLERAGLRLSGVYGDYDLGPLTEASERMIVIAERGSTGGAKRAGDP